MLVIEGAKIDLWKSVSDAGYNKQDWTIVVEYLFDTNNSYSVQHLLYTEKIEK